MDRSIEALSNYMDIVNKSWFDFLEIVFYLELFLILILISAAVIKFLGLVT